jgi:RNA polymerase sigma-70 factor (ECF subfamily)
VEKSAAPADERSGVDMPRGKNDSNELIRQAARGDRDAREALFARHRARLKRMVRVRLHPRLLRRIDESDVVQDVLLDASSRLDEYLQRPPVPFFLWLRRITAHKLVDVHRRHFLAARRDLRAEVPLHGGWLPSATSASLAAQLLGGLTSPSSAAVKAEMQRVIREALSQMDPLDREVMALRHFEQLSNGEAALVLEINESACSNRYVRALARLKQILRPFPGLCD